MIIADFNQLAISTIFAEIGKKNKTDINEDLVRHMIINALRSYKMKFGSIYGELIIASDNRNYWRKTKFQYYKANRKKTRDESDMDWDLIYKILNKIKEEIVTYLPYHIIDIETTEADDVIAIISEWSQNNDLTEGNVFTDSEPKPLLILSGDKDFIQLQKYSNIKQYAPIKKKYLTPEMSVNKFLMEHIISGDSGDGIPNIKSSDDTFVSESRQRPIKKEELEKWSNMSSEEFISSCDNKEIVRNFQRNQMLIDFKYIPEEVKNKILDNFINRKVKGRSRLLDYFIKYKMKHLINCLSDF